MPTQMPTVSPLMDVPQPLVRNARVWVGYSGGLDSTVLLHRLAQSPLRSRLQVVQVHHGLQKIADEWAQRAQRQCRDWQLPFRVLHVQVDPDGQGLEAAAREARYAALDALMRSGDVLVTAHHRDDQAETVLLNLLRGAGVEGLAAMRPWEPRRKGWHWRPLLTQSRDTLQAYAQHHALQWIDDAHNADPRFARSFLRQEIFPRLHKHWPQAAESLARAADNCADAETLIATLAETDCAQVRLSDSAVSVAALLALSAPRRQAVLRYWLRQHSTQAPDREMLLRLESEVLRARVDAAPLLKIGNSELRRYRDALYVMAPLAPIEAITLQWNGQGTLPWSAGGALVSRGRVKRGALVVRTPCGGEGIRLHARRPTRTLKHLFQEAGVPPWIRSRVPLIYQNDELLSVAGRWWSHAVPMRQRQILWQHDLPGWNNE